MRRVLAILFLALAFAQPALAVEYLTAVSDLPLAEGLSEDKDKSTVFDSPIGQIVSAYASGNLGVGAVRDFYDATLPQLGWVDTGNGNWRRHHQVLKIDVLGADAGPVHVTFTLSSENP